MVDREALNVYETAVDAGVSESREARQQAKAWPGGETGEQLPVPTEPPPARRRGFTLYQTPQWGKAEPASPPSTRQIRASVAAAASPLTPARQDVVRGHPGATAMGGPGRAESHVPAVRAILKPGSGDIEPSPCGRWQADLRLPVVRHEAA